MAAVTATAAHSGTRQGWWIPEEMDLHGVSLFPSPVHPHKAVYCADEDASTQARPSVVDAGTWDEGIKRKPSDQAVDEYEVMDDDFRSMSDTLTNALLVVEQTQRETEKQQLLGEIEERDRQLAKVQEKLQQKSERVMELATRLGQRDDTIEKLRSKLRKTKSQLADAQQELERFRAFAQTMPGCTSETLLPLATVTEKGETPYRENPYATPPCARPRVAASPVFKANVAEPNDAVRKLWAAENGLGVATADDMRVSSRPTLIVENGRVVGLTPSPSWKGVDWVSVVGAFVFILGCFATNEMADLVIDVQGRALAQLSK